MPRSMLRAGAHDEIALHLDGRAALDADGGDAGEALRRQKTISTSHHAASPSPCAACATTACTQASKLPRIASLQSGGCTPPSPSPPPLPPFSHLVHGVARLVHRQVVVARLVRNPAGDGPPLALPRRLHVPSLLPATCTAAHACTAHAHAHAPARRSGRSPHLVRVDVHQGVPPCREHQARHSPWLIMDTRLLGAMESNTLDDSSIDQRALPSW